MRIALDAMGGDQAPEAVVAGALLAAQESKLEIILVGRRERVQPLLPGPAQSRPTGAASSDGQIRLVHATEVIEMEDSGPQAVRRKKDSSLVVCADLVANGEADAFVSAGHSGAGMAAALMKLGTHSWD